MLDWLKKVWNSSEEMPIEDQKIDPKIIAENTQVLVGMQDLALQLGATQNADSAMESNLQKLRKEGSGL